MLGKFIDGAPCPFCGGTKLKTCHDDGRHWIECRRCFATGPAGTRYTDEDEGDFTWNTRAHEARLEGERGDGCPTCSGERAWNICLAGHRWPSVITPREQQAITSQPAPHIGMDYLEIRRRLSELSGVPTMAITTDEHLTRIKAPLERESITAQAGSAPKDAAAVAELADALRALTRYVQEQATANNLDWGLLAKNQVLVKAMKALGELKDNP